MGKIYFKSLCILVTTICIWACSSGESRDIQFIEEPDDAESSMMEASVVRATISTLETRAEKSDDGVSLVWSEGDSFGLFNIPSGGSPQTNIPFFIKNATAGAPSATFVSAYELEWGAGATFYGIYPYNERNTDFGSVSYTIPQVQYISPENFVGTYDVMFARAEYGQKSDIELKFEYPLAVLEFAIDASGTPVATEIVSFVDIEADVPVAGDAVIDLLTGAYKSMPQSKDIRLEFQRNQSLANDLTATAHVFPSDFSSSGVTLTFHTDMYQVVVEVDIDDVLQAGSKYRYDIPLVRMIQNGSASIVFFGKVEPVANTYIARPGRTLAIPVSRAWDVWQDNFSVNIAGSASVELLWQDEPGLIAEVELAEEELGREAKLVVKVNSSGRYGNALVAYRTEGIVRWSWQIWVTDYDPDYNFNGTTYMYNNGGGDYTFMDRHLGAMNTTKSTLGQYGYLYQWGRKDPFPGGGEVVGSGVTVVYNSRPLYDIENNKYLEESQTDGDIIKSFPVETTDNLRNAVENPTWFYHASGSTDWLTTTTATYRNDNLWGGDNGLKSVFDPCPYGWKVPVYLGGINPWIGMTSMSTNTAEYGEGRVVYLPYDLGYYPNSGYRDYRYGGLVYVGQVAYTWTGTVSGTSAYILRTGNGENVWIAGYGVQRANAGSVRCVKE